MSTEQQRVGAPRRYLSRLTRGTLAVIMAGGRGERLKQLTEDRCKPATPFGGKFRIIDFVLSNCLNSGIRQISVLTQYKAHSLIQHIGRGWGFLRGEFGEFIEIIPAQQRRGPEWYQGTADALWQNMELIRAHRPLHVLVLAGDHIYKMDYGPMIGFHVEKEADITVGVVEVPIDRAREFGVLGIDERNRVLGFQEKPNDPPPMPGRPTLRSRRWVSTSSTRGCSSACCAPTPRIPAPRTTSARTSFRRRSRTCACSRIRSRTCAARRSITGATSARSTRTTRRTWNSCASRPSSTSTTSSGRSGRTRSSCRPPSSCSTTTDRRGCAIDSMVSGGCIISGSRVSNSLLFSQVRVHDYSSVDRSVILPRVHIGEHCVIRNAIIDEGAVVPDGTMIGVDPVQDRERFHVSENGVTLVTASMLRAPARGGAG